MVVVVIVIRSFLDQAFHPGTVVGLVVRGSTHVTPLLRFECITCAVRRLAGLSCGLCVDIRRSRCRGRVTLVPQSPPADESTDADLG